MSTTTPLSPEQIKAKRAAMLVKVRKALALAESERAIGNDDTADAHDATAARLMATYNIDRAMAERREHKNTRPTMQSFHVDAPHATAKVTLLSAVGSGFGCTVYFTGSGRDVTAKVYGFEDDIESVVMLFTSLLLQVSSGAVRIQNVQYDRYGDKIVRTQSARRAYILGFSRAVRERYELARAEAAKDVEESTGTSTELVLASREQQVQALAGKARTVRMPIRNTGAYQKGQQDGMTADLHNRERVGSTGRALSR